MRSGGQAQTEADYPPDLRSFGDYDLESEIARGGMGVVYRARQKSLNRIVALKMILSGRFAGPDELRRFREEAGAAARLDHPCIVPIYEVGQHQGQHYFSMGLVDGQSMDHWLRRGPMQVDIAAAMLRSIAAAMAYAHSKGVVHRDLKPANILIAEADSSASQSLSPRITDFGLAKQTGRDDMTGTGQILGTPSYMAPEQATGNTDAVGPLSDVYSIGAIGYAMVTGGPPFRGATTMDTLRQVIDREPAPPRQLNSAVPRDLETILLKCLNKDPRKRYEDAAALTSDLERFIEGGEIQARPISRIERFGRTLYRHRVAAALTSSTLLLLLVMAICGPLLALSENRARSSAETALRDAKAARANAEIEKQRAQEASEEAQRQRDATEVASQKLAEQTQKNLADLYAGEIHWAYRSWTDGAVRRMRNRLQRSPEDQRGWEWDFLDQLPEANTRLLQGHNSAVGQVVVDADGKTLSTVGEDRYILKWDLASGKMIQRRSQAAAFNRISPDAQTRLSITPAGLSVADIESSDAIVVDPVADDSIVDLRWSADGRTAAMLCQNQSDAWLRLINVPLVRDQRFDATMLLPVVPIPATGDTCLTLAVSNDGTIIWVGTQNGRLHRFNRSSKKWNETPAAKNADASTAFAEFNEPISALTQSANTQKHSTEELSTQKYNIQGQTLWVGTQRGSVFKLDARDGSILQTRRRQLRPIRAIALSPDRRLAAIAGDFTQVQLWETERLDEVHRLAGASDRYDDVAFTRDSNSLVGCGDSGVNVWKLESSITSGLESLTRDYRVAVDTRRQPLTMCPAGRPGAAWLLDRSGSVDLWDIREHRPIRRLRAAVVGEIATAIAVSGDGDEVAVALQPTRGDANARIEVWGTLAEEKRRTLQTSVRQIDSLIAMPERPGWIAAGGSVTQQPGGIDDNSVADRPGQREIKTAIELEQPSKILVFRNQDTRATAQWFARSPRWNRLARIPGQSHIVATSDDGKVSRIDVETGQIVREMRAMIQIQFSDVTASPDGQRVAAIGNDRRLRIWNGDDGVLETVIEQAGTGFYGLRFLSPNRLTTVSDDGFMRIWRVEDGAEVLRLPTGTSSPRGWIVTPDAGAILLTSGDHAIRSWSLRRSLSNDADPWDTNVWDTSGAAIADRDAQSQQPSDALDKRIQLIDLQTGQIDSIAQRSKPNDAPANGIISENGQWTRRDDATTVRMTASINAGSATLSSATRTYGGFRLPERYSFGLRFQSDGPMGLFMGLLDDQGSMLGASFQSERNPLDNTRGIS
ncbi:MAG: WD40 repeat domain-containing serine/threonine protein kinase, partial [Planctomycetota bacterium]